MREMARQTSESIGRLLVVDDDLVQRTVIGKIGAKLGYDTITASSFDVASGLLQNSTVNRRSNLTPYRLPILTPLSGSVWR